MRALGAAWIAAWAPACAESAQAPAAAPAALAAIAEGWRYSVTTGEGARELEVDVALPAGPARRLSVDDGAEPFVRDVAVAEAGSDLRPIAPRHAMWRTPDCPAGGCRLRYRFLLADAADALDNPGWAAEHGGAFLSPPSAWLLHPLDGDDLETSTFRLRVGTPEGIAFVTGLFPSKIEPAAYEAPLSDLLVSPYSAFGPIDVRRLHVAGAVLDVGLVSGELSIGEEALLGWITTAARSVAHYYGRFPVPRALVVVLPVGGGGPGFSSALGHGGASIMTRVGRGTTEEDFARDWQMTHEMVHLAFPNLARRHAWLEEGLATYVEPIARARLGLIPPSAVWRGLALGLPKGLPMPGDRGLDHTPTWGRRYWGGALFCLLADLGIRERTGNARSLDDALRGILAAGGDISVRWDIERALEAGDRATGVPVLAELYARMKDKPVDVDLDDLWRRLGVGFRAGRARFDDDAPLADVRTSITARGALARR